MGLRVDKFLFLLVVLVGLYFYPENYWRSIWWDKWFLLMGTLSLFVSFRLGEKYHPSLGVFTAVSLLSALWVFGWRNSYPGLDLNSLFAIGKVTAYTFSSVTLMILALTLFRQEEFDAVGSSIAALCFFDSAVIIWQALSGDAPSTRGGVFGNPSISGSFIAFSYPFLCFQKRVKLNPPSKIALVKRITYLTTPVLAIFLTYASQPVGILIVVVAAFFWQRGYTQWKATGGEITSEMIDRIPKAVVLTLAGASLGLFILWYLSSPTDAPFNSTGRFGVWAQAFSWWRLNGHVVTGQGTGITQVLLPLIQLAELKGQPGRMDLWLWFHSDWAQLLFENGIIGLISGLTMYAFLLIHSFKKAGWLFSAVCGFGAAAIFNFPVHFPLHAFAGAVMVGMTFDKNYLER